MLWQEIILDVLPSHASLAAALAAAFGVSTGRVAIVDSEVFLPEAGLVSVACERTELSGAFPLRLTVYVYDHRLVASKSVHAIATELATQLGARCLISDDEVNPYTRTMVTAERVQPVTLNVSKLDEEEEYWLD